MRDNIRTSRKGLEMGCSSMAIQLAAFPCAPCAPLEHSSLMIPRFSRLDLICWHSARDQNGKSPESSLSSRSSQRRDDTVARFCPRCLINSARDCNMTASGRPIVEASVGDTTMGCSGTRLDTWLRLSEQRAARPIQLKSACVIGNAFTFD